MRAPRRLKLRLEGGQQAEDGRARRAVGAAVRPHATHVARERVGGVPRLAVEAKAVRPHGEALCDGAQVERLADALDIVGEGGRVDGCGEGGGVRVRSQARQARGGAAEEAVSERREQLL